MNTVHYGSTTEHHKDPERTQALRRAATASFIGNFIEWFDYASYGYLAGVIGSVFFPESDRYAQLLYSFLVFAHRRRGLGPIGRPSWAPMGTVMVYPDHVGIDLFHRLSSALRPDWDVERYRFTYSAHDPGLLGLRRVRRRRHLPG